MRRAAAGNAPSSECPWCDSDVRSSSRRCVVVSSCHLCTNIHLDSRLLGGIGRNPVGVGQGDGGGRGRPRGRFGSHQVGGRCPEGHALVQAKGDHFLLRDGSGPFVQFLAAEDFGPGRESGVGRSRLTTTRRGTAPERSSDGKLEKEPAPARDVGTVFFRVVDQPTKKPISGVLLKVSIDGKVVRELTTDESARMVIPLPATGFERLTTSPRAGRRPRPRSGSIPARATGDGGSPRSYTLAMEAGCTIDRRNRPGRGGPGDRRGVTIRLYENSPEARVRETFDFDEMTAKTDTRGRWHPRSSSPAALDLGRLHFTFSHPELPRGSIDAVALNVQPKATPEQLRNRSGVIVLRRGIAVTGRVLDRDGHPIAGASVRLGDHFWKPAMKTEADGRFSASAMPPPATAS